MASTKSYTQVFYSRSIVGPRTKAKDKFRSTHSNVAAVNSSKWEYICQCIADGRGVVGTFAAGKRLHQLKFGQVYSPPANTYAPGHAVVFVGAIFYQLKIIYIFLNSWSEQFCAFRDEDGKIIVGGLGMVDGVELLCNPVVLSRSWEEVVNGLSGSWRLYSSNNEAMSDVECMVNPEKLMPTFVDKKFDVCASYDIINKKFDIPKEDGVIQDEDVQKKAIEGNAEETTLIQEGKEMKYLLYTYHGCVKALPQVQLAADMQRFSRPERLVNGPMITHFWSTLKLLDALLQLDHLKNAKASIPNDFSWYKRTFSQVSSQWQDIGTTREELDDLQVDICLDLLAEKLNERISTYFKSCAASALLDSSFTYVCDDAETYVVKPL